MKSPSAANAKIGFLHSLFRRESIIEDVVVISKGAVPISARSITRDNVEAFWSELRRITGEEKK